MFLSYALGVWVKFEGNIILFYLQMESHHALAMAMQQDRGLRAGVRPPSVCLPL